MQKIIHFSKNSFFQIASFLAIFFSACSTERIIVPESKYPILPVDASYDLVNNFKPGARFDMYTLEEIQKIYFSQSPLERLKFHTAKWSATPYKLGGISHIKGADCSAFSQQVMQQSFGVFLPRSTVLQRKVGKKVPRNALRAGDLLFFRTSGPNGLHVGIYLANDEFIHLSEHGGARLQNLNLNYWRVRYLEARRYLYKDHR